MKLPHLTPFLTAVLVPSGVAFLLMAMVLAFSLYSNYRLAKRLDTLTERHASSSALLEQNLGALAEKVASEEEKSAAIAQALAQAEGDIKGFERQFGKVTDTVDELEKLSKADPKLLQKYSKVFFLNEHYEPARLSLIKPEYLYSEGQTQRIHAEVLPYLTKMINAAKKAGVEIYVKSAFRSFEEQRNIKSSYSVTYGAGTANTFSADQGYSEHQLGTTVDLITTGMNGALTESFEGTAAFKWLTENAYEYGFTLSYPKGNAYYMYEPWHWRFVGEKLAEDLHDDGKYFYDLEQRKIDEYLAEMFD